MTDFFDLAKKLGTPAKLDELANTELRDPFPVNALPESLREWAPHAAKTVGVPVSVTAMTGLAALSAAMGLCEVALTRTWIAKIAIWVAILADSGKAKSAVLELMTEPVAEAEKRLKAVYQYELPEREQAVEDTEKKVAEAETCFREAVPGVAKELARADLYAARTARNEAQKRVGHEPDLSTQDGTPEGIADALVEQDRVLANVPEGDAIIRRLTKEGGGSAAIYLQAKNGERFSTRLRSRPKIDILNPFLAMAIIFQPVVLKKAIEDETLEGGGFIDRLIVVPMDYSRPREMAKLRNASAAPAAEAAQSDWAEIVTEAYLATFGLRGDGKPVPRLVLDADATVVWDAEFDAHQVVIADSPGPRPSAALKADQTAIGVAALRAMERVIRVHVRSVRAAAASAPPKAGPPIASPQLPTRTLLDTGQQFTITAADVAAGWKIAHWSLRRIAETFGEKMTPEGEEIAALVKIVRRLKTHVNRGEMVVTPRDIYIYTRGVDAENIGAFLDTLTLLDWLVVDTQGQPLTLSKWRVYPRPDIGVWLDKYYPEAAE